jgi:hypothetical protein
MYHVPLSTCRNFSRDWNLHWRFWSFTFVDRWLRFLHWQHPSLKYLEMKIKFWWNVMCFGMCEIAWCACSLHTFCSTLSSNCFQLNSIKFSIAQNKFSKALLIFVNLRVWWSSLPGKIFTFCLFIFLQEVKLVSFGTTWIF